MEALDPYIKYSNSHWPATMRPCSMKRKHLIQVWSLCALSRDAVVATQPIPSAGCWHPQGKNRIAQSNIYKKFACCSVASYIILECPAVSLEIIRYLFLINT